MATVSLLLEDKVLVTKQVPDHNLLIPGYAEGLRLHLIEEHEDVITITKAEPRLVIKPDRQRFDA